MRFYMMVAVAAILLFAGCGGDDEDVRLTTEVYRGRYIAGNLGVAMPRIDSVELTINNGSYFMFVEGSITPGHLNGGVSCNSTGDISGFASPVVRFKADSITQDACDFLRVPDGSFSAHYAGDSLVMTDTSYITYTIQRNNTLVTVTDTTELIFQLTR